MMIKKLFGCFERNSIRKFDEKKLTEQYCEMVIWFTVAVNNKSINNLRNLNKHDSNERSPFQRNYN